MSDVYVATQVGLDRLVVLKVLRCAAHGSSGQFLDLFRDEARLVATLRHRFLASVHDYFEDAGRACIVMELIDGRNLHEIVAHAGPFAADEVDRLFRMLSEVLHYLHSLDPPVVVRDLKPQNVMLERDRSEVRLIDFGIAKRSIPGGRTRQIAVGLGTEGFAPPEQHSLQPLDARSDIYALGATLYFLLKGAPPRSAVERGESLDHAETVPPQHLAPSRWAVVRRMMTPEEGGPSQLHR